MIHLRQSVNPYQTSHNRSHLQGQPTNTTFETLNYAQQLPVPGTLFCQKHSSDLLGTLGLLKFVIYSKCKS